MPELPDITIYIEALERRIVGRRLQRVRIASPFLLRTADPPLDAVEGRNAVKLERIGKRIAIGLNGDLWLVLHLMIAGRLHWRNEAVPLSSKRNLAAFDFSAGCLLLTEAGSKRRASLHVVPDTESLRALDPGGLDVLAADLATFTGALTSSNHTLKRALTDPKLFSGIGNAYSDEILHRARLSPVTWTTRLSTDEIKCLFEATLQTLNEWIDRLRDDVGEGFPKNVTAFREEMAVHGRFGRPCPDCGSPVQRIRYAENETNYCARCQTGGKLLADRSLSRLLKGDWPKSIDQLE